MSSVMVTWAIDGVQPLSRREFKFVVCLALAELIPIENTFGLMVSLALNPVNGKRFAVERIPN